ncbi:MAG: carbon-nitrogen hydrolase family protein [SAR324 cluster bacterium]|nr:carbon-nitrogen hydrolase family protein [SAR324 cluster bacterium]MBL7035400.1 carbon-nitrogen hydrolase family protein [SAR324 cluster bacterium]
MIRAKREINIACLQTRPRADFKTALDEAIALAEEATAAGADFLTLPEYCGGLKTEGSAFAPPFEVEESHPVLNGLRDFAKNRKKYLLIGSIAVKGPREKTLNRSYIIDDFGNIISRYDKIHLFDIKLSEQESYRESTTVHGGQTAVICQTPLGCFGQTICYDLRFPHLYRVLSQAGAEILFVPAAFTKKTGEAHWHVLNRARAIENSAFVVAPCAVGKVEGGGESYGHSLIINPWGEILADGEAESGFINVNIKLDEVDSARSRIPSLSHDKSFEF